jgi:hypothetical protein
MDSVCCEIPNGVAVEEKPNLTIGQRLDGLLTRLHEAQTAVAEADRHKAEGLAVIAEVDCQIRTWLSELAPQATKTRTRRTRRATGGTTRGTRGAVQSEAWVKAWAALRAKTGPNTYYTRGVLLDIVLAAGVKRSTALNLTAMRGFKELFVKTADGFRRK